MSDLLKLAENLGGEVLQDMKGSIGDAWSTLSDHQRATVEKVATKVVEFRLRVKLEPDNPDLKAKLETWESAVLDWKAWGVMGIEDAFWKGVARVGSSLGSFLGALGGEALGRLIPGL
jgi:hypothetical protein